MFAVRLLKENKETEVRIFDGSTCYQWKYFINKINDDFIEMKRVP